MNAGLKYFLSCADYSNKMERNNKKTINAWAFYDWANSAYFLVISTAIFPAYFIAVSADEIPFFSIKLSNSSVYAYAVAFSYVVITILSPILSGIADYGGKRKFFLKFFTYLGSLSCIALSFFGDASDVWIGVAGFILATIGASGGLVFYNAYLPEITTEDKYDQVSARGYAFGYVGSVLLMLFILFVSLKPLWFGIPQDTNIPFRMGFALVGLWWMGFAQIPFRHLGPGSGNPIPGNLIKSGIREILSVYAQVKKNSNLKRFLWAFLFYSAGVQTVIYLAGVFAKEELGFDTNELILIILILQILAIFGAYLFAWVSKAQGNKRSLLYMVLIWLLITFLAYFVESHFQFYLLAGGVGLVMGGIQSLSRSSYSKLVDEHRKDLTSFFSFYDIVMKISIIMGTFSFGAVNQLTGGLRPSVLALSLFFILGFVLLLTVRIDHSSDYGRNS